MTEQVFRCSGGLHPLRGYPVGRSGVQAGSTPSAGTRSGVQAVGLWVAALGLVGACARAGQAGELAGTVRDAQGRPLRNAVVFVTGVRAGSPPTRPVVIDQRRRTFLPHVTVVLLGTTVLFPNNDTVFHNVFSFRDGKRFDLGLYPVGSTRKVTFDQPGLVRIFCNIHSTMSAYLWVVENPYYDQTGADGVYRLHGVPNGTYTVQIWHPKAGSETRQITFGSAETRHDPVLGG